MIPPLIRREITNTGIVIAKIKIGGIFMLKKILFKIKNLELNKIKNDKIRQDNLRKYYQIRNAVIAFFKDKQITDNTAEIPPFINADKILLEKIKNQKDLNFFYQKLVLHNKTKAVI